MPTTPFYIERLLPCSCTALSKAPFPCCPECGGDGVAWQEVEVLVEYEYERACRGVRDSYGAPLEPDEPAGVEIIAATDANGREVELTPHEADHAEERCLEDAEEARIDALAEAAERRYELARDRAMGL